MFRSIFSLPFNLCANLYPTLTHALEPFLLVLCFLRCLLFAFYWPPFGFVLHLLICLVSVPPGSWLPFLCHCLAYFYQWCAGDCLSIVAVHFIGRKGYPQGFGDSLWFWGEDFPKAGFLKAVSFYLVFLDLGWWQKLPPHLKPRIRWAGIRCWFFGPVPICLQPHVWMRLTNGWAKKRKWR